MVNSICEESKLLISSDKDTTRNSLNSKERRRRWKIVGDELRKLSPCVECGNDDYRVIDFHHRNPEEKDFSISWISRFGFSDKNLIKMLNEVDKCDTLCANCHRILHWTKNNK